MAIALLEEVASDYEVAKKANRSLGWAKRFLTEVRQTGVAAARPDGRINNGRVARWDDYGAARLIAKTGRMYLLEGTAKQVAQTLTEFSGERVTIKRAWTIARLARAYASGREPSRPTSKKKILHHNLLAFAEATSKSTKKPSRIKGTRLKRRLTKPPSKP